MDDTGRARRCFNVRLQRKHKLQRRSGGVCRRCEKARDGIEPYHLRFLLSCPVLRARVSEEHPLRPQDPYSISKLVVEGVCDAFARKSEMQIASLRFAGICTDLTHGVLFKRRNNPLRWTGPLWTYVDVRDAAAACRLAIEASFSGHEAFNVCAPNTIMKTPTAELVREYLPGIKLSESRLDGNWSGYDPGKARKILGFTARHLFEGR